MLSIDLSLFVKSGPGLEICFMDKITVFGCKLVRGVFKRKGLFKILLIHVVKWIN